MTVNDTHHSSQIKITRSETDLHKKGHLQLSCTNIKKKEKCTKFMPINFKYVDEIFRRGLI